MQSYRLELLRPGILDIARVSMKISSVREVELVEAVDGSTDDLVLRSFL